MRLKFYVISVFTCIVFQSCSSQNKKLKKINGLSFVSSKDTIDEKHILPVQKVSANYVALMPFGFIKSLDSPEVRYNASRQWFGETKAGIRQYVRAFRKTNIRMMLKPQLWVWHGEFTGDILMASASDWKILEDSYANFILDYAKLAEELDIEILCVGTELEQFVMNRPDYWLDLIKEIKKVYHGKLTYAANWDEFKRISFWKELDFIGIDAYFPLSEKKSPGLKDFEMGWKPHKTQIESIQKKYKRPILFTEFGYRSIHYTGVAPWQAKYSAGNVDLEAQKNATQAIYNQFWNEDWFAGGFVWKWFHDHSAAGGSNDNRFTPQNKPAEALIKELYAK